MTPPSDTPTVVLTGANAGIGYHMLSALVRDDYRVAALDVDGDNVRSLQDRSPDAVRFYECDVADTGDVREAVGDVIDRWGRIDVLVNNAAVGHVGRFDDQAAEDVHRAFEVNVFGYLRTIRAVLPHMRSRDDGIIHNVGSGTGALGHPGLASYAATKGAIRAFTRSLRLELRRTGVTCTLMVPPTTDTGLSRELSYPAWMVADAKDVGRKLAARIDSTDPVITPDWQASVGLSLVKRVPGLWPRLTERAVDLSE